MTGLMAPDGSKSIGVKCCNRTFATGGQARRHETNHKAQDAEVEIRIAKWRQLYPDFGYRRITALLKETDGAWSGIRVNHKRVLRIMQRMVVNRG